MIYLDNSATTHARQEVIDTVTDAMQKFWINPSAAYAQALDVEKALENALETIDLPEKALVDIMPYGVASFMASFQGDSDSQQFF